MRSSGSPGDRISGFHGRAEVVVVDDGSDEGADIAGAVAASEVDVPLRTIRLRANTGRFLARRAGLQDARGTYVLLLDAGIRLEPTSIAFVEQQAAAGRHVWNGHVEIDAGRNMFGLFWSAATAIAFYEYFKEPRTTSFTEEDFDRYPKGTGCFSPRASSPRGVRRLRDTLRRPPQRERRRADPSLDCESRADQHLAIFFVHLSAATLASTSFRHGMHRGVVFLDGHGHRNSRFFPFVVAFYPVSIAAVALAVTRPRLALAATGGLCLVCASAAAAARRPVREAVSFGLLAPVYAVAHGLGMWRGVALAGTARRRRRSSSVSLPGRRATALNIVCRVVQPTMRLERGSGLASRRRAASSRRDTEGSGLRCPKRPNPWTE